MRLYRRQCEEPQLNVQNEKHKLKEIVLNVKSKHVKKSSKDSNKNVIARNSMNLNNNAKLSVKPKELRWLRMRSFASLKN